jgi:hypothetical protein
MSMISGLIDELNKSADEWNGSNMFELARMCREAADTIWQLRDDLQRANAAVQDAEHDESMAWDRVRKAEAENAKLRESLEKAAGIIADICGECPVSRYEWLSSDGCAERCGADTEEECWIAYLTGKRWDESGAEVDE